MLLFVTQVADELKIIPALDPHAPASGARNIEIEEVDAIRRHMLELLETIEKASASEALTRLSVQVAHDIRSPLAALDSVIKDVSQLPEEKRIIVRSAVSRIHDIANDLIRTNRELTAAAKGREGATLTLSTSELMTRELLSSCTSSAILGIFLA